ncbi:subtilisin-like protease SBT1.7 [Cryptomeria japonica]|uniref:subtilisin-like protease SBT1.7 n=1 Tax=Cryptomeria japonica TaxID=3369 RepID=UPI0027DA8D38|nr:subtilisin-like protease SBT1.7 [Cryptomeria japonica]
MANPSLFSLALFVSLIALTTTVSEEIRKPYIVYMNKSTKPLHFSLHEYWYVSLINEATSGSGSDDESLLLYTYDIVLDGFAAKLSRAEAARLESMESCLAVIPSSVSQMHTTRSPQFLGLGGSHNNFWPQSHYGKDVIVGVIDTGIWPESESFNDRGLGPVPAKWKGVCQSGEMFNSSHCNRKLIGARYFFKGYEAHGHKLSKSEIKSARDSEGHGTHCASTAVGSKVGGASFNGFANGTARGMAPQARLAVYKVLWLNGADASDLTAAIEMAVSDGVDIISMSIGKPEVPFYEDSKAIGAFKAMAKGVLLSLSAGNDGPFNTAIENTSPWMMTVGASSIDRKFPAAVRLGNHEMYRGSSLSQATQVTERLPLLYLSHNKSTRRCQGLDGSMFNGKILLCDNAYRNIYSDSVGVASQKAVSMLKKVSTAAKQVGVAGLIWATEPLSGAQEIIDGNGLPSISVGFAVGKKIKAYINSTSNPTAAIKPSGLTVKGKAVTAPLVVSFSGRGPSREFPHILKPDVIAPGLDILAAVKKGYEFMSGTSMSCPHVSGLAALIRGVHPSWSPAAIKSALMTSAYIRDNKNQPIKDVVTLKAADPFALGAGHVNPAAAMDPGLVYDLAPSDYIHFLCTLNYTDKQIALLMDNHKISCPRSSNLEDAADLNYPSFTLFFNSTRLPKVVVRRRTVTNVGAAGSTYKVQVEEPSGMKVSVEPATLEFTKENQKLNFRVIFQSAVIKAKEEATFGEISWNCVRGGTHVVRSPVVVQWRDI